MPRSLFAPHLAEIVALAKRHAFHTKNVIGGRRVKIEIRKRKGEQEMFSREGKGEVFETEDHLSIFVSIDFFRRDLPQRFLRSEEHTSELQSLMRISYAVYCLKKKKTNRLQYHTSSHAILHNTLYHK